jgi:hypothetical protein
VVKAERKEALKESHKRFVLKGTSVFADLETDMIFGIPYTDGLLSANLSLADNLRHLIKLLNPNLYSYSFSAILIPYYF